MTTMEEVSPLDRVALDRLRRLGGDSLIGRMIDLFLQHSLQRMEAARTAFHGGDLPAVALAVHSLKSSAGNLGAHRLQRVAGEIELRADDLDLAGVTDRFVELEGAFTAAHARLTQERSALPT